MRAWRGQSKTENGVLLHCRKCGAFKQSNAIEKPAVSGVQKHKRGMQQVFA